MEQLVLEKTAAERRVAEVEQQLRGVVAESAAVAAQLTEERDRMTVCGSLTGSASQWAVVIIEE